MEQLTRLEGGLNQQGLYKHSTPKQPLVSIITVVLNGQHLLEKTIQSVLNQSYKNIEYIVIDGRSKDGTISLLQQYNGRIDYWLSEPDHGIADAMNKGLKYSRGILINHLHAGDKFTSSDVVANTVDSYLEEKWKWCFGAQQVVNLVGEVQGVYFPPLYKQFLMNNMSFIPHQSVFAEKDLFEEVGMFNTYYKFAMDYHLLLKFSQKYSPKQFNRIMVDFLMGGTSSNKDLWMIEEIKVRESLLKRAFFWRVFDYIFSYARLLKWKLGMTTFLNKN